MMKIMIRLATVEEANLIHKIMLPAFEENRFTDVPSDALNETVSSIEKSLNNGSEKDMLYFMDGVPVGSVRFKINNTSLCFFRLSDIPEARKRGIAKSMILWLENYAGEHEITEIWCRVRSQI